MDSNKTKQSTQVPLQETHVSFKDAYRLNVRRWKNILQENGNQKREVGSIIPHKINFTSKILSRDKGYYRMIK